MCGGQSSHGSQQMFFYFCPQGAVFIFLLLPQQGRFIYLFLLWQTISFSFIVKQPPSSLSRKQNCNTEKCVSEGSYLISVGQFGVCVKIIIIPVAY